MALKHMEMLLLLLDGWLSSNSSTKGSITSSTCDHSTVLYAALFISNTAILERLLIEGVDVNTMIAGQTTALHIAAAGAQDSAVQILLSRGANANVEDIHGWTPSEMAAICGKDSTCCILSEIGCGRSDFEKTSSLLPNRLVNATIATEANISDDGCTVILGLSLIQARV
ncbi:MAG: hypothetical protein MMC33_000254 [Icmadophila ericetorum]|nr:hypothetical protein [Icmadophila ericetorum]